jgi:C-terminal processing protease CtpA/Prc
MEDLGAPIAYLAVESGTPVYAGDGREIGTVEHVLADAEADVFDGLIVDTRLGPGGWRFVDAPDVAELHERGVVLKLDSAAAERLPEPSENPGALRIDPADAEESVLVEKLRRAWDYISGRY